MAKIRWEGSLQNRLMENTKAREMPKVGDGATILMYTDRHAATVVMVDEKRKIVTVQQDNAKRVDDYGMSDCQEYEYASDPGGAMTNFRLGKDNRWSQVRWNDETNRWNYVPGGNGVIFGVRRKYYDFSF